MGTHPTPHPAAPGSWQRSGAGSQLLQGPPGRIWWCFSGHVFCCCSRLLFGVFFLAFTLRLPPEAGGSQHTPGTSPAQQQR